MLTAADIAYMQDTQDQALPGTVVIERYTLLADGMGGMIETWAAVGTAIGRIYPRPIRGQGETLGGAQVQSTMEWHATFPIGTDVSEKDRLYWDSRTWEVIRTNGGEMWKTAVRCDLQSMNQERRV